MSKIFIIIVVNLLFWTSGSLAQFNTVRIYTVGTGVNEKPGDRIKQDSLEWMNGDNYIYKVRHADDSVSKGESNSNVSLPLKQIEVTSSFGYRIHPVDGTVKLHAGIDLKANYEPFYCFADGIVLRTGYDEISGNYLVIYHGKLETVYCHLSLIAVKEGERVIGGQLLGITGNTGRTTAPHLHFGMKWEGKLINPEKVIRYVINH